MGLREDLGGKLEEALNKLVDEKLANVGKDFLKSEAHKLIDKLIDDNYDKLVAGGIDSIKKLIDKIDGEVG